MSCKPALLSAIAIAIAGCGGSTSARSATHSTSTASATSISSAATANSSAATANAATATSAAGVRPGARLASGFRLSSPAFRAGGAIPRAYTCDGRGASLPLRWTGAPRGAKELVLVMRDPDAPGGTLVHWAVAGIPPTTRGFPAGGVTGQIIPGRDSFGSLGYRGPCPPRGTRAHHYVLTLVALSGRSGLRPGFTPDQLQSRALAIATLIGTYARS